MKQNKLRKYLALAIAIIAVGAAAVSMGHVRLGASGSARNAVTSSAAYDTGGILMSTGGTSATADLAASMEEVATYEPAASLDSGSGSVTIEEGSLETSERKLVKTYYISLETTSFDETVALISERAAALGGYVESSSENGQSLASGSQRERYAYILVRIPTERVDEYLSEAENAGNVTYRSENVEDITLKYTDTATYLEVLRTEQARLLELLAEASSVDDLVALNTRLTEVERQIESSTRQIRLYDNQVDYTSISFDINEVKLYSPEPDEGILSRMKRGIAENIEGLCDGVADMAVSFVSFLPTLAVLAVIFGVVYLAVMKLPVPKRRKKSRGRKAGEDSETDSGIGGEAGGGAGIDAGGGTTGADSNTAGGEAGGGTTGADSDTASGEAGGTGGEAT